MSMATDKDGRHNTAAILNHDIILHVLDFLRLQMVQEMTQPDYPARTALARCARVTHAFSNPALRLLWSTLHTLLPLWFLLAPDGTPISDMEKEETREELLQTIVDAGLWTDHLRWDRFLYYGRLVRTLLILSSAKSDGVTGLHAQIAHTVVEYNGGRTVLPSLLALTWMFPVDHGDITRLVSPSVVRLVFNPHRSDHSKSEVILRSIRKAAPLLQEFISMRPHASATKIAKELVQCQALQKIDMSVPPLSHRDVHSLLSKLRLTELRVGILLDTGSAVLPLRAESLRDLTIDGVPRHLATIFPKWSFPTLQRAAISLMEQNHDGGADLHEPGFLAAIVAPLPFATLRHLGIFIHAERAPTTTRTALPLAQLLRPAFQLRGLWTFRLNFFGLGLLSADDTVFSELAASWPELRTLRLSVRAWHGDGPVPTPLVLVSLARSCADLQTLHLPYLDHTVKLERLTLRDAPPTAEHQLRELFIADDRSKEDIIPEVAEALCGFVDGLFPCLSPQFRRYLRKPGKAWTEVLNRLREGDEHSESGESE